MPGKYSYVINGGEKTWTGTYDRTGWEAPPGKAVRPHGRGDDESFQFEDKVANDFILCMPEQFRGVCKVSRDLVEVPKEKLSPARPSKHKKVVENEAGKDYPAGLPTMDWDRSQCGAFIKENEPEIEARVRVTTAAETIVLAVWKKHDPARYDRYMKDSSPDNIGGKRKA